MPAKDFRWKTLAGFYRKTLRDIQWETACIMLGIRKAEFVALRDEHVQRELSSALSMARQLVEDIAPAIGHVNILKPVKANDPSWENLYLSLFLALCEIQRGIQGVFPGGMESGFSGQVSVVRSENRIYTNLLGAANRLSDTAIL